MVIVRPWYSLQFGNFDLLDVVTIDKSIKKEVNNEKSKLFLNDCSSVIIRFLAITTD